ncbi:MAG: insulinase family protein [Armatimonadetes bacterium]|nr:insulinase family protein [Armatimonadota bacterium]
MLPAIFLTLVPQVHYAPALKETLPNGAQAYVERFAAGTDFALSLFVDRRGVATSSEQHGWLHLLEHIAAKGPEKSLDAQLEIRGLFLRAETLRDGIRYEIVGPGSELSTALALAPRLLAPVVVDADELSRETAIMRHELAELDSGSMLSNAAWTSAFGEQGRDPHGSLDAMAVATPEDLESIQAELAVGVRLSVAVIGAIDVERTMEQLRNWLGEYPPGDTIPPDATSETATVDGFSTSIEGGAVRLVLVDGFPDRRTLATVGAAMAISLDISGSMPRYTPTVGRSLVSVSNANAQSLEALDRYSTNKIKELARDARRLIDLQLASWLRSPSKKANIYSVLHRRSASFDLERARDTVKVLTPEELIAAVRSFQSTAGQGVPQ